MKRILALILCVFLLAACGSKTAGTWQENYDLGVKYLSEGNYKEAIIAFTAAIEIDPRQRDAYVQAVEAYLGAGDIAGAKAILQKGIDVLNDAGLRDLLEQVILENPQTDGSEEYVFETEVEADGDLNVESYFLSVRVADSRTATITVSGLDVKDSYPVNLPTTQKDYYEYNWEVTMRGDQTAYNIATTTFAFNPGQTEQRSIRDMQHTIWYDTGSSWTNIGDAEMSYTADSITWTFTVPEEYPFDFAKVNTYEVSVVNVPAETELTRIYNVKH